MTQAQLVLRQESHLTLRLQFDFIGVLQHLQSTETPSLDLATLASLPDTEFSRHYQAIKSLLQQEVMIKVNDKPIASLQFRFQTDAELQRMIRERMARFLIQQQNLKKPDAIADEQLAEPIFAYMLADGFIARTEENDLELHLPAILGAALISFSEPVSATVSPSESGIDFQLGF